MICAYQMRFELRETAFSLAGKAAKEGFADHQPQNRIADELELLVIALFRHRRALLGQPGAMGERAPEQAAVAETVFENVFKRLGRLVHRGTAYLGAGAPFSRFARSFCCCAKVF